MPVIDVNMESYQQLVDTKAKAHSPDILPNAGEKHAAIAMAKLFDNTLQSVKMIVGSFSGPVCDQQTYR